MGPIRRLLRGCLPSIGRIELLSMSNHGQVVILKILNGVQNGVEIALEDGEYVIGSGAEDDLQITDVALKPGHAKLRIVGGAISIAAGAGAVVTSTGLSIETNSTTWHDIDQLEVVTIATTRFAVAKASANWNSLLSSASLEKPATPPQGSNGGVERSVIRYAIPVTLLFLLLGFGAVALSGGGSTFSGLVTNDAAPDIGVVRTAISDFPFAADILVDEEVDGTIYARGYVGTLVERRAISDAVRDTGIPVRLRLWARDVIENELSSLLEARSLPLTASVERDGTVVLKGTVLEKDRVDEVGKLIAEQVLGVSAVRSEVRTAQNFLEETLALAARSKIADGVLFRLTSATGGNQLIEATGAVRNDQVDAWLGFLKSYAASIADTLALRSYVEIEGRTVVLNEREQDRQDGTTNADVMPIIVARGELAAGMPGRSIPLDLLLNNQTSYDALVEAVAPGARSDVDASRPSQSPQPVVQDTAGARVVAEAGPAILDTAVEPEEEARPDAPETSIQDNAEEAVADARPSLDDLPLDNALRQASDRLQISDGLARQPVASAVDADIRVAGESVVEATIDVVDGDPDGDPPVSTFFDQGETIQAFRELNEATSVMLDMKDQDRLKEALGEERGADLEQAFRRINRRVSEVAAVPLPAERSIELGDRACWPGSRLSVDMLPTLVFWLDLLSVSNQIAMNDLVDAKRGIVLEAGLSPTRVRDCLLGTSSPAMKALAEGSIYLSEARRNPKFIQFLLREDESYDLAIVGAKTSGERYLQIEGGETLEEGASPTIESRISSIGELGVLVRVPNGYMARVYPDGMPWHLK